MGRRRRRRRGYEPLEGPPGLQPDGSGSRASDAAAEQRLPAASPQLARTERDAAERQIVGPRTLLELQQSRGNAYVQGLIRDGSGAPEPEHDSQRTAAPSPPGRRTLARQPAASEAPATDRPAGAPDAAELVGEQYPHLLSVLTTDQLAMIQLQLNARHHNLQVQQELEQTVGEQREKYGRGTYGTELADTMTGAQEERAAIREKAIHYPRGSNQIEVPTEQLLAADVLAPKPWNVATEINFREELWDVLAAHPTTLVIQPGLEPRPLLRFFWGPEAWSLPQAGGRVGWDHLMQLEQVRQSYYWSVERGPVYQDLITAHRHIRNVIRAGEYRHEYLWQLRGEQPNVSWISERLGALQQVMRAVVEMAEGETPVIQVEMPTFDIWGPANESLHAAFELLQEGQVEVAGLLLALAEEQYGAAYERLLAYQEGALGGAGAAAFGLQMVKIASLIFVSVASGSLPAQGASLLFKAGAAGFGSFSYSTIQQTFEQSAEIVHGLRDEMDSGEIFSNAGADAISTFVGFLTGGAFTAAFEASLGNLLVRAGLNPGWAAAISDILGGTASTPVTTAVNIHVDAVLRGSEDAPATMEEFWSRVSDDLWKEGIINVASALLIRQTGGFDAGSSARLRGGGGGSPRKASMGDVRSVLANEPHMVKESGSTTWHQEKWKLQGGAEGEPAPPIFERDGVYYVDQLRVSEAMRAEIDAAKGADAGGSAAGDPTSFLKNEPDPALATTDPGEGFAKTEPGEGFANTEPGEGFANTEPGEGFANTEPRVGGTLRGAGPELPSGGGTEPGLGPGKAPGEQGGAGFEDTAPGGPSPGAKESGPPRITGKELRDFVADNPKSVASSGSPEYHQDMWEYLGGEGPAPPAYRVEGTIRVSVEDPSLPRDVKEKVAPPRKKPL